MDLKVHGLTPEIIKEAFAKTNKARNYILDDIMLPVISEPRKELSKYALKCLLFPLTRIKSAMLSEKAARLFRKSRLNLMLKSTLKRMEEYSSAVLILISARGALEVVRLIATDPEVGAFYNGVVTRVMNFGAFVEIAPGKEGLVHISRLDVKRTEKVEDCVNVGDSIIVKCIEIDDQGRINLSRRDALIELEGMTPENDIDEASRKPRRDFKGDRRPRR